MFVPAWKVLCFNFVKKPIISALWYAFLAYTVFIKSDFLGYVVGVAFLLLSFTGLRFHLGLLSPIPCIAELIVCRNVLEPTFCNVLTVAGVVWLVIYAVCIHVLLRLSKGVYEIDPLTNEMKYNSSEYILSNMRKR